MRAMIVGAGLGTRLLPLTELRPKPALPVRGLPLVAYNLALLHAHGVREVVVNVHHLAPVLEEAGRTWAPPGLAVRFSREEALLGTGGGIRRVAGFLRESDPCLVLGGDMILDFDLSGLVRRHRERGSAVTLLLRRDRRAARFGTIGVDREGRVRRIAERFDLGAESDAGVYAWANVVSARAFDALPDREAFVHLDDWWAPLLRAGARDIHAEVASPETCAWEPIGTPAEYLAANLGLPALSFLDVEAAARSAGAVVRRDAGGVVRAVLGAGATLGAGARLDRAVVWDGERVPEGFCGDGGVFAGGRWVACDDDRPAGETRDAAAPGGAA